MIELIKNRIKSGLIRDSISKASDWALQYRVMGKPFPGRWTFDYHPWAKEMLDSEASTNYGQKSSQVGFTEVVLNLIFKELDINGVSWLYVLPATKPDAHDFSASRFDPALEYSEHLANMFSDVKNVGHKRAGMANLFIRGSRSRSQLKSIPVGGVVLDEVDEMVQDNIPLVLERLSGQIEKKLWAISTPTIPDYGINNLFLKSTQEHFFFKCPKCNKRTELIFPDCLKGPNLICKECKGILKHEEKKIFLKDGEWVASKESSARGFYINHLYSSTISPEEVSRKHEKSLLDAADEQEFYNSSLGLPHIVDGARIIESNIEQNIKNYTKKDPSGLVTMGIDVGTWLHYEIDQWIIENRPYMDINSKSICRLMQEGKVKDFEELEKIIYKIKPNMVVIDANPERRKAVELVQKFFGRVCICFYGRNVKGKDLYYNDIDMTVNVDRTSWMDAALGRFKSKRIQLPSDLSIEYKENIKVPVRVPKKDNTGNIFYEYVKSSKPDHFAHARVYSEIGLALAVGTSQSTNISGVL